MGERLRRPADRPGAGALPVRPRPGQRPAVRRRMAAAAAALQVPAAVEPVVPLQPGLLRAADRGGRRRRGGIPGAVPAAPAWRAGLAGDGRPRAAVPAEGKAPRHDVQRRRPAGRPAPCAGPEPAAHGDLRYPADARQGGDPDPQAGPARPCRRRPPAGLLDARPEGKPDQPAHRGRPRPPRRRHAGATRRAARDPGALVLGTGLPGVGPGQRAGAHPRAGARAYRAGAARRTLGRAASAGRAHRPRTRPPGGCRARPPGRRGGGNR
ncbi:Uncharacterised protein [Pseudomonas aeruginosa]|nr:Uncharacterised protein [Pseudomonas aeruginosa]